METTKGHKAEYNVIKESKKAIGTQVANKVPY